MILINSLENAMATETTVQFLGSSYAQIALLHIWVVKKSELVVWLWDDCVKEVQNSEPGC